MRPSFRWLLLQIHKYVGLVAAAFLIVASLTGGVLAFESDFDRWLHPELWRVTPWGRRLPQQELLDRVQRQLDARGLTAPIEEIDVAETDDASQVFVLADGRRIFVNPYNATILTVRGNLARSESFVLAIHQLHVQLLAGNAGRWTVDAATLTVLLLVPTGLYLWWREKRLKVKWRASGRRVLWDLHNVIGICGSALVLLMSATGLLLAFETPLDWVAHSQPWRTEGLPRSIPPENSQFKQPALDQFLEAAGRALPDARTYQIRLPQRPRSPVQVWKRGPGLTGHSTIYLDRYSGDILRVDDLSKLPRSYRAHLIDQAIHTGTVFGLPSKILLSTASFAFAALAITGVGIWWPALTRRVRSPRR